MKRPAETQLSPEGHGGTGPPAFGSEGAAPDNPFAGISLSASTPSTGSLFSAAASGTASNGFAAAATEGAGAVNGKPANPFMGLSLFSPPASGGLFTSAANSLNTQSGETAANGFSFPRSPGVATEAAVAPAAAAPPAARAETEPAEQPGEDGSPDAEEPEEPPQDSLETGEPTGEEEEEVAFRAECRLWKLVRRSTPAGTEVDEAARGNSAPGEGWHWQERGCGIVHINRHGKTGAGRLVMRMRGVLKLLLNTPVFPTTTYERVGQKSVRFVGVDAEAVGSGEGQVSLCAYRLSLQSSDQQGKFLAVLRDLLGVSAAA